MRIRLTFASVMIALLIFTTTVSGQSENPPPIENDSSGERFFSADAIMYNTLYATAGYYLWSIDSDTGVSSQIGYMGFEGTDIAFFNNVLYGISFSALYRINPDSGTSTFIGNMGYNDVNGLTVARDGTFFATTLDGYLLRINSETGRATRVGYMGDAYSSAGDVAIDDQDHIYAAVDRSGYYNSWLVYLNRTTGAATPIIDIGFNGVWGLSFKDGELFGVTSHGQIINIDTQAWTVELLETSTASFWGLSTSGKSILGSITSPEENANLGLFQFPILATASYPGGTGIHQVEFYYMTDGIWKSTGSDTSDPYSATWIPPAGMNSQQMLLRINVVGNDLLHTDYAGGVRRVNIYRSYSSPSVIESWVSNRVYLNQRALDSTTHGYNGDALCSVASMAMVLAMENYIADDFQTLYNKAIEMYPHVLGLTSTGELAADYSLMDDEFIRQDAPGYSFAEANHASAWELLVSYINTNHPVILRTEHDRMSPYGHFIVIVGYQVDQGERTVIAYDPFGKWRGYTCTQLGAGCHNNYYLNMDNDPVSYVGQWVYYDFDLIYGDAIVAAAAPMCANIPTTFSSTALALDPLTPPDQVSDEPQVIGTYLGALDVYTTSMFLPIIQH